MGTQGGKSMRALRGTPRHTSPLVRPGGNTVLHGAFRRTGVLMVPVFPIRRCFSRLQDVTEIIRQNKEAQNAQKCGFQKAPS